MNPATNRAYVANGGDCTVSVIDGGTNSVVATVPVADGAFGVGLNPTTGRLYVTSFDAGTVSVIDGASKALIATVPVGKTPVT